MAEDGSTLPPMQGFNLMPSKLGDLVPASIDDPQLSPNGLYPSHGHQRSPVGNGGDLIAGLDSSVGALSYTGTHLSQATDLNLQHYRQEQKSMMGTGFYDNCYPDNMYNQPVHSMEPVGEMYKSGDKSGYIDMLNSGEMVIKKEKLDYDNQYGIMSSESTDMPYPPNTCVSDWNYYNPTNTTSPSYMTPMHGYTHNLSYSTNIVPNHHMHPDYGFSNHDLHNQAKKITQNILESNWSSETLYKSPVYNNMAADSISSGMVRKRKQPSGNSSGAPRGRKRKTPNITGHSKTVASILLSEQNQPVHIGKTQNGVVDPNILNSSARDEFVTSLMNNLRTTVQFESFCLSFPRSEKKESAFQRKVALTANLVSSIDGITVCSNIFPENLARIAEKYIVSFKQALAKMEKMKEENKMVVNASAEVVEEQMPHSMLWVVRLNSDILTANWEGQFVATVNPLDCTLCFSLFQFTPDFSSDGIKSLHQAKLSKDLAKDIIDNMQQFEVSRQLRFDIKLNTVAQIYLYSANGEENEGVLILEFSEEPIFYQRWLRTSAEDKNKWRTRSNFFTKESVQPVFYVYFGGLLSELNELIALIFASIPDLKDKYEQGLQNEFIRQTQYLNTKSNSDNSNGSAVSSSTDVKKSSRKSRSLRKSTVSTEKLRQDIVGILVHFKILDSYELEKYFGLNSITHEMCNDSLQIDLDTEMSLCFRDYINFRCESVKELAQILEMQVRARASGFFESDYHPEKLGDRDIDSMTVAELIRTKCSDTVYYSFCHKEIGQLGHDQHCSRCHQCNTWRFWHCSVCDKCTNGGRICQFCGHHCDNRDQCIIKPLSVYKTELENGSVSVENIKLEWTTSLTQSDTDIVKWPAPKFENVKTDEELFEYNTHNAMMDELGLLNPVGFMFGQPTASRKHRRNKTQRQISKSDVDTEEKQSGSGCSVQ